MQCKCECSNFILCTDNLFLVKMSRWGLLELSDNGADRNQLECCSDNMLCHLPGCSRGTRHSGGISRRRFLGRQSRQQQHVILGRSPREQDAACCIIIAKLQQAITNTTSFCGSIEYTCKSPADRYQRFVSP